MKSVVICCALLAFASYSHQYAKFENCSEDFIKGDKMRNDCVIVHCQSESSWSAIPCATSFCQPGKFIKMKPQNPALEYPDCCEHPICAE